MTRDEFHAWLAYHLIAYRHLTGFFGNMNSHDRAETQQRWFEVLCSAELADAKSATDEMFRDESGQYAALFDQTPATVRKLARACERKRNLKTRADAWSAISDDRQPRYRCAVCLDTTWVSVWHPRVVHRIVAESEQGQLPANWREIICRVEPPHFAVTCNCRPQELADRRSSNSRGWLYDPARLCECDRLHPERILEWERTRPSLMTQWEF